MTEFSAKHPFVAAGFVYLLLVCIAYSSVIVNFPSAIPGQIGTADYSIFYWNIWWFQHAIFHLGQDPFYTNYILYPHVINLAYHSFAPFIDAVGAPLFVAFGPTVAFNSLLVVSLVFDGLAMFSFLRHRAVSSGQAFVGGALFVFNTFVVARISMSHLHLVPIGWLPLSLLVWDRLVERRSFVSAIVLGAILYAAFMTDQQYGMWLAMLLGPYILFRLFDINERRVRIKAFSLGLLSALILFALMLIAPLPQTLAGWSAHYPSVSFEQAQIQGSVDPAALISLPDRVIMHDGHVTLGILLPMLIVIGVARGGPKYKGWLLGGLIFIVLMFGPTLSPYEIPLPYRLLHVALGGIYRAPARFIAPAIFVLIVFAMFAFKERYQRLNRRGRYTYVIGVLVLIGLENRWGEPFPFFTVPDYSIYHTIGADPDQYLVLEVPVGADNTVTDAFGTGSALAYYAAIHHKQLINGRASRAPAGTTHDYRQWKLITALAEERPVPDLTTAQREFQQLSHDWDIRYVIIHRDMISPETANWAIGFFNARLGWCLVDEEGPVLAYHRLDGNACTTANLLDPPQDGTINIGDGNDDRYLGLGWYLAENVGGPQARWTGAQPTNELRVHLSPHAYHVTIQATAYVPTEMVAIDVNDTHLTDLSISDAGWGIYNFDLPATTIPSDGLITLTLAPTRAQSAFDRTNGQANDKRPLAVAYDSIKFTPAP